MSKRFFAIKKPSKMPGMGKRATFAIQEVSGDTRLTLPLEAVDAINQQLLARQISFNEAERQVVAVRDGLYSKRDEETPKAVFSSENLELLDRYWVSEYEDRDLVDPATMRYDLKRAVASVGTLSLLAADKKDLQAAVNAYFTKASKQRRAVARLNQLLLFAGRKFRLRLAKKTREVVKHLTWGELQAVLPHLPSDEWRTLATTAWVTGCRTGETFALLPQSLREDYVRVEDQIDKIHDRRHTKTRSTRRAFILRGEMGRAAVRTWISVSKALKDELRDVRHSNVFRSACKKAFPENSSKHMPFKDLRHSYAVEMIGHGVPLSLVAQNMGNSIDVCEYHYSGFVLQDEVIETVKRLMLSQ